MRPEKRAESSLSERQQQILKLLLECQATGETDVGSSTLARLYAGSISSATVRNEIRKLAEAGYALRAARNRGVRPSLKGWQWYLSSTAEPKRASTLTVAAPVIKTAGDATAAAREMISVFASDWKGAVILKYPRMGAYQLRDISLMGDDHGLMSLGVICTNGVFGRADAGVGQHGLIDDSTLHIIEQSLRSLARGRTLGGFGARLQQLVTEKVSDGRVPRQTAANFVRPLMALARSQKARYHLARKESRDEVLNLTLGPLLDLLDEFAAGASWFDQILLDREPVLLASKTPALGNLALIGTFWGQTVDRSGYLGYVGPVRTEYGQIKRALADTAANLEYYFFYN